METRASYVVVGTFVLALTAAAFGVVIFLTRTSFEDTPRPYMSYFSGSVTGLQAGSPVRYRGVPVGTVTDIRIDPNDVEQVRVIMEIVHATPVKTDTVATLGLQGLTGVAYIELTGGTKDSAPLTPTGKAKIAVITSKASGIEQVLEKAPELLERAVAITERLALILDDRNLKSISDTLANLSTLTGTLAGSTGEINQVLADSQRTFAALKEASENVAKLTGGLNAKIGPLTDSAGEVMKDVRKAINGFNKVAVQLEGIVSENRTPLQDFSSGGLYEISQFIAEARVLISTLTRLSGQIERDPARFFFGDTQKGFEAK
jgi:phospholipid/cholesterol/gamma-HCH transport system substrate-binding protein